MMDNVVINLKSGDTFITHRFSNCYATLLNSDILKIELEDGNIYYMLRLIENIIIKTAEEEDK